MKVRNLFLILLLLTSFLLYGCGSSSKDSEGAAMPASEGSAAPIEAAAGEEAAPPEENDQVMPDTLAEDSVEESESSESILEAQKSIQPQGEEDVVGVFEYLEDNHTAVFSFDSVEVTFHFEDSSVQEILMDAIAGSSYTLSYQYDNLLGLDVIYQISE